MKYFIQNNVKIIQCTTQEFSLQMNDSTKKDIKEDTYINAGLFGWYESKTKGKANYTLPVCPLVADIRTTDNEVIDACKTRTKVANGKVYYDSYSDQVPWNTYKSKNVTCFIVENGKARIDEITNVKDSFKYCVGGVPLLRNGKQVTWSQVKAEGFGSDSLYATMHSLIGLKKNDESIYLLNWKSTTGNMVSSGEAYKKFSAMGFTDVLKLDGGGSCIMNAEGKTVASTSENRRINNIIVVKNLVNQGSGNSGNGSSSSGSSPSSTNSGYKSPYPEPKRNLYKGCKGSDVKWLQDVLTHKAGIKTDIDGSYGNATRSSVVTYQKRHKLDPDGCAGTKTQSSLKAL